MIDAIQAEMQVMKGALEFGTLGDFDSPKEEGAHTALMEGHIRGLESAVTKVNEAIKALEAEQEAAIKKMQNMELHESMSDHEISDVDFVQGYIFGLRVALKLIRNEHKTGELPY